MGFGDVRLAALLGFALGHVGWAELLVGIYSGFLVFGLPGLLLALVRWDRRLLRDGVPVRPVHAASARCSGVLAGPWLCRLISASADPCGGPGGPWNTGRHAALADRG